MDITHACQLLYIQIARESFHLADQERRTGGGGRRNTAPPSATVTSGSGTELATSDTGGPTFSKEQELPFAPRAGYNNLSTCEVTTGGQGAQPTVADGRAM